MLRTKPRALRTVWDVKFLDTIRTSDRRWWPRLALAKEADGEEEEGRAARGAAKLAVPPWVVDAAAVAFVAFAAFVAFVAFVAFITFLACNKYNVAFVACNKCNVACVAWMQAYNKNL